MALKIVFLDEYTLHDTDLTPIKKLGDYTGYRDTPHDKIVERCKDADVVISNKSPMRAETIEVLPNLKLICIAATGMNNVDLKAAEEAGVVVRNAIGYSTYSVAEQTIMGVLALYKQLPYFDDYVKSGDYTTSGKIFNYSRPTYQLKGKQWGIIGLGNIGRRVAELATAFGCEVSYYSTSGVERKEDYKEKGLDQFLSESDIISVHAPLSRDTYHLLDVEEFDKMKKDAIVVNVARGSLINEQALADALNQGKIAGAALDVYSAEPMEKDNPIMSVEDKNRLVLTPHSAWSTKEALVTLVGKVAENIIEFKKKNNFD